MFTLRRASDERMLDLVRSAAALELTYPEVGATARRPFPSGYAHDDDDLVVGHDDGDFEAAAAALRSWAAHRGAGVAVFPAGAPLAAGTDVALRINLGVVQALARCRVVDVVDEDDRFGFAYGTLPGHPEIGEESFMIERVDGAVRARIASFSRPVDPLVRVAAPLGRLVQRDFHRRYLRSLQRAVARARR